MACPGLLCQTCLAPLLQEAVTFLSIPTESLPSLRQEAHGCLLSGCSSSGFERLVLLPESSHCWTQWLFHHLLKGDLYVQAEILIGKATPFLEMPLECKGFLELKKETEPSAHQTPTLPACTGAPTVLLGMSLDMCVWHRELSPWGPKHLTLFRGTHKAINWE